MQTMYIAAKSGLPKELLQRMQLLKIPSPQTLQFKYNALKKGHLMKRTYISDIKKSCNTNAAIASTTATARTATQAS